ncbi:MAG: hypothetical protein KDJ75_04735 [Alphaproteobacteria bacterium]|nr:hypothetical protein [Alphaproteobacteria bacterium]
MSRYEYGLGMKRSFFIIGLLLIAVGVFEFHPAVEEARSYVSVENYENAQTPCQEILAGRPWTGTLNYWFFAWLVFVPALIFSTPPAAPQWMRGGRVIVAAGICYVLMNLAVHLQWDIRNAPFMEDPFHPDPVNGWRMDCANYAGDGFSYVTALMSAWIPACIYTGLYLLIWRFYHHRFSKEIMENYKSDLITRILFWGLKIYAVIFLVYLISLITFITISYILDEPPFHPGYMWLPYYFIVRPLFIPTEIFNY